MNIRAVMLLLALLFAGTGPIRAQVPAGWLVGGNSPQDYNFTLDSSTPPNSRSALIASKPEAGLRGFGTLMQQISAENYRGQHVRLSGYLKTESATRAQLWMRVDGQDHQVLSFDNMDNRPVTGTTGWKQYDVVLEVPNDSVNITFGFLLTQGGKVWGHDFKLQTVDTSTPATASAAPQLPKEPVNMDFQVPAPGGAPSYDTSRVDVYDIYRKEGYYVPKNAAPLARAAVTPATPVFNDKYNLCGMHVLIESKDSAGVTLRWDLKLSVAMNGSDRFANFAAGAFELQNHGKTVPRRPITHLEVQLQGEQGPPAEGQVRGTPNSQNGVVGEFPEVYAERLFDAFDAGTPFTLNLTYDSGERESILARTHGDNLNHFYHGTQAPARQCLGALVPTMNHGLKNPLVELWHPK